MNEKPTRVHSDDNLELIRSQRKCEWCGDKVPLDAHHIKSKGAGGGDELLNLIGLCRMCHGQFHAGKIAKANLLLIAQRREENRPAVERVQVES